MTSVLHIEDMAAVRGIVLWARELCCLCSEDCCCTGMDMCMSMAMRSGSPEVVTAFEEAQRNHNGYTTAVQHKQTVATAHRPRWSLAPAACRTLS